MTASSIGTNPCDALDQIDLRRQSPALALPAITVDRVLVGRCKSTLWADGTTSRIAPLQFSGSRRM